MALTKSLGQNIKPVDGNGLSTFVDDKDGVLKLKDINGCVTPMSTYVSGGGGGLSYFATCCNSWCGAPNSILVSCGTASAIPIVLAPQGNADLRFNSDGSGCSNYFNTSLNQWLLGSSVCPTYNLGQGFAAVGISNVLCSGQRDFMLGIGNVADHSSRWNSFIGRGNYITRGTSTAPPISETSTLFGRENGITQCGNDTSRSVRNVVMLGYCNVLSIGLSPLAGTGNGDALSFMGFGNSACCVNTSVTLIGLRNCASKGCNIALIGRCNVNSGCDSYTLGYSNTITSNGTFGGGFCSTNSGSNSTFIGGCHLSSGISSSIGGGFQNCASADYTTIAGGRCNSASGLYATVSGGLNNKSICAYSAISGGQLNCACGVFSGVFNGFSNCAMGNYATILGGCTHKNLGILSTIVGGGNNLISAATQFSNINGGKSNCITLNTLYSTVSGGYSNTNNGSYSFLGGGSGNAISSTASSSAILGGNLNITSSGYSIIGGGQLNSASGVYASVFAGNSNKAVGQFSNVTAGLSNCVNGGWGFIGGGATNTIIADCSNILGGLTNTISVDGTLSSIVGGTINKVCGSYSLIGAGSSNTICSNTTLYSNIVGGLLNNVCVGSYSSVLGGRLNNLCHDYSGVMGCGITSDRACTMFVNNLSIKNIPTSSAGLPSGSVWSNSGVLNIVP